MKKIYNRKNGVIGIDRKEIDLALYVMELKIADTIKNNNIHEYSEFREKLLNLKEEKKQIYQNNEKVINKVLNEYVQETKK